MIFAQQMYEGEKKNLRVRSREEIPQNRQTKLGLNLRLLCYFALEESRFLCWNLSRDKTLKFSPSYNGVNSILKENSYFYPLTFFLVFNDKFMLNSFENVR